MRRLLLFLTVACGVLGLLCSSALAYSTPSDLGSWPNRCPPWPADNSDGANTLLDQEIANLCLAQEDWQQAQHSDLSSIDSDTTAQTKALSDSLSTLQNYVQQEDSDIRQLDADLKAQPGPATTVDLGSPTLNSLSGIGEALHEDLFLIVGVIIAGFVLTVLFSRIWP